MLALAEFWSRYSTCLRRQVGAVIFDPETFAVISVGFNDAPIGAVNCGDGGCPACSEGSVRNRTDCLCIHGELNAVLLARTDLRGLHLAIWNVKNGISVDENSPCTNCHKHLVQTGISQVLVGKRVEGEYLQLRYVAP